MDFALESAYRKLIRFSYTSFDRIVVRGHVPALQGCGGIVLWSRRLRPDEPVTDSWLGSLARRFHEGVKNFAAEHGVPILDGHRVKDKFNTAAQYRAQFEKPSGVYLIIRARETCKVYHSYEGTNPANPNHRNLISKIGFVDQYYFYLVDPYWGPISLRLSSHLPFNVTVYLNGNRWLALEAERQSLGVTTNDNSIVRCSDPKALQRVADSLDSRRIQSVCDHWAYRLLPVFTAEERVRSLLRYQWFLHQVEMSHNMVFQKPQRLTEVLERHVDLNRKFLQPYSIKSIFRNSPQGPYCAPIQTSVRHAFGGLTILSAQYADTRLKQYNNHQQTFRTEACCNNVHDLGVHKPIENLGLVRQGLLDLIVRFQQTQERVVHTTCNRGELTALAKPGQVNATPTPGIKLENERILLVLSALLRLVHCPGGFRSRDLRPIVQTALDAEYSASQATYDLRKLRGKGFVQKDPQLRRYRVTDVGMRVAVLLAKLRDQLLDPVLGVVRRNGRPSQPRRPPHLPDSYYIAVGQILYDLTEHLGLAPAA